MASDHTVSEAELLMNSTASAEFFSQMLANSNGDLYSAIDPEAPRKDSDFEAMENLKAIKHSEAATVKTLQIDPQPISVVVDDEVDMDVPAKSPKSRKSTPGTSPKRVTFNEDRNKTFVFSKDEIAANTANGESSKKLKTSVSASVEAVSSVPVSNPAYVSKTNEILNEGDSLSNHIIHKAQESLNKSEVSSAVTPQNSDCDIDSLFQAVDSCSDHIVKNAKDSLKKKEIADSKSSKEFLIENQIPDFKTRAAMFSNLSQSEPSSGRSSPSPSVGGIKIKEIQEKLIAGGGMDLKIMTQEQKAATVGKLDKELQERLLAQLTGKSTPKGQDVSVGKIDVFAHEKLLSEVRSPSYTEFKMDPITRSLPPLGSLEEEKDFLSSTLPSSALKCPLVFSGFIPPPPPPLEEAEDPMRHASVSSSKRPHHQRSRSASPSTTGSESADNPVEEEQLLPCDDEDGLVLESLHLKELADLERNGALKELHWTKSGNQVARLNGGHLWHDERCIYWSITKDDPFPLGKISLGRQDLAMMNPQESACIVIQAGCDEWRVTFFSMQERDDWLKSLKKTKILYFMNRGPTVQNPPPRLLSSPSTEKTKKDQDLEDSQEHKSADANVTKPNDEMSQIEAEKLFIGGQIFLKYRHGRSKVRTVWCGADLERIHWGSSDRYHSKGYILSREITQVIEGCKGTKRINLAFTIVTPARTLELEAPNEIVKKRWLKALKWLVEKKKASTNS